MMRASVCVGRVGGLAVALGVGAVVSGISLGAAGASPSDSSTATDSYSSGSSRPDRPVERSHGSRSKQVPATQPTTSAIRAGRAKAVGESLSTPATARKSSTSVAMPANVTAAVPVPSASQVNFGEFRVPMPAVSARPASLAEANIPAHRPASAVAVDQTDEPVGDGVAQPAATTALVEPSMSPLPASDPSGPAESTLSWAVLGVARRELNNNAAVPRTPTEATNLPDTERVPAAAETTVVSDNSPQAVTSAAAEVAVDPITAIIQQVQAVITQIVGVINQVVTQVVALINQVVTAINNVFAPAPAPVPVLVNAAPIAGSPTIGTPDLATGVITGTMAATDPDGDPIAYSGSTTSKGSVTVSADGNFTYIPTAAARHNAAYAGASISDKIDVFTVTAADGRGGAFTLSFTVTVVPANNAPEAGGQTVGAPNPSTGLVTGKVTATDRDGDSLTFSGPSLTAKGSIVVDPSGTFTYTPTNIARRNASALGASDVDKADTFIITASDGHGGTIAIPVTVAVGVTGNLAPVAGSVTFNSIDAATGAVTGTLAAVDPDGDSLTYSGSGTTSTGALVVNRGGTFTFTPNAAARDNFGTLVFRNDNAYFGSGYSRAYTIDVNVVNGSWLSTVSVIDTASNAVVNTADFRMAVQGIGISPDGSHTYLINNLSQIVAVDLGTGIVNATIQVPNYPYDVVFSPDSSRAYVRTNTGIVAIDTATDTLAATISSPQAFRLVVSPDGTRVYGSSNSGLLQFDAVGNTLAATIATGPCDYIALSADGSRAYVTTSEGVTVLNTATNAIIRTIPVAVIFGGMVADASHVYVTVSDPVTQGIGVSVIDMASNTVAATIQVPPYTYFYPRAGGNSGFYAYIQNPQGSGYDFIFVPFDPVATQARQTTVTVTVDDGHGGMTTLPVIVPIIPRWQF